MATGWFETWDRQFGDLNPDLARTGGEWRAEQCGPEHFALMGLRRVRRGGITRTDGHYLDDGVPIQGCLLPIIFENLVDRELVVVTAPEPGSGLERLFLTEAGQARYLHLVRTQRGLPTPPPERHARPRATSDTGAEPGAGQSPTGHRPSTAPLNVPPSDQPGPSGPEGDPPNWWTR